VTDRASAWSFVEEWFDGASAILDHVRTTQVDPITKTSELAAGAIASGGLVHLFGTGHSRIPLEELFPRYGSYPGFHPIAELSMTFHTQITGVNGQRQAMFIERVEGLGEVILSNFQFGPDDVMVVFSSGGTTAVPIEVAIGARHRGLPVVAVTSVEHSLQADSAHSSGTRLLDHADIVIDLGAPVGDSLVQIDGIETRVGPSSTIANVAIANAIKVQTAALLYEMGALPPVLSSGSVVGADRSAELFEAAYRDHGNRIAAVLRTDDPSIGEDR
jgi:uncharacterized phosphosugar-binding protein